MILLSFDTEEFDVPREHGVDFTLEEGMKVSRFGTERILDILKENNVKCTFFCTANFVTNANDIIQRIIDDGHEIACHGCDHWTPLPTDAFRSKEIIEQLIGMKMKGYRQPRMFPVNDKDLKEAGYVYNSSLNPAFVPGRYMHLTTPRTYFMKDGVLQIPTSVSPLLRIPLFWLALHNFPEAIYYALVKRVLKHDGYFNTYFHPWEFYELKEHPEFKMPLIIRNHSGKQMQQRLDNLIKRLKAQGGRFYTYAEFAAEHISINNK